MAPTRLSTGAGKAGPGSHEPAAEPTSSATNRQAENERVSTPSPATTADSSIGRLAPQFSSGNSRTARPSASETTRPRTKSGPPGIPVDSSIAKASAEPASWKVARITGPGILDGSG